MSKDKISKDEMSKGEMSKDEMSKDEMSKDEMSKDEMSKDEMSKDEMSKDEMSLRMKCPITCTNGAKFAIVTWFIGYIKEICSSSQRFFLFIQI